MSLRRRLLIAFAISVLLGFGGFTWWAKGVLRNSYAHVVEDVMIDISQLVASQIEADLSADPSSGINEFPKVFENYKKRKFEARIFNHLKTEPSLEFYVTDAGGKLLYSSRPDDVAGSDFSIWKDVSRTLQGDYGARATRVNEKDPLTSVYYVAAPIRQNGKIVGAVSIIKARGSIDVFLSRSFDTVATGIALAIIAIGAFGSLLVLWITKPVDKLRQYAIDVSEGRKAALPEIQHRELRQLGESFEKMRVTLEGKNSIERTTQALTHELKSPLTGIRGAAELCLEPEMPLQDRTRFLSNVIDETRRMELILERLLSVAALEAKTSLDHCDPVQLRKVIESAKAGLMGLWEPRKISIDIDCDPSLTIIGDEFLLTQVFRNLLQNAVEFSSVGDSVVVVAKPIDHRIKVSITDHGTGLPAFVKDRMFEKFFSTERPDTKKKGTGLGLSFVKETMALHQGEISFESPPEGEMHGTQVLLWFEGR